MNSKTAVGGQGFLNSFKAAGREQRARSLVRNSEETSELGERKLPISGRGKGSRQTH